MYFSTVVFAFEGICVVMPVYHAMKEPQMFLGWNRVLTTSIALIIIVYVAVGFFGFIKFGANAAPSVTLNLPKEPLYESVRLIFMLAVFLSTPLQLLVIIDFFWTFIECRLPEKMATRNVTIINLLYRSFVVFICCKLIVQQVVHSSVIDCAISSDRGRGAAAGLGHQFGGRTVQFDHRRRLPAPSSTGCLLARQRWLDNQLRRRLIS